MAKQVEALLVGADVSKAEIVFCVQGHIQKLVNDRVAIRRWLRSLTGPARVAVEATNTFHLALVEEAHALGQVKPAWAAKSDAARPSKASAP